MLKQKVLRLSATLHSLRRVTRDLKSHGFELKSVHTVPEMSDAQYGLDMCESQIRAYAGRTDSILKSCDGISELVSQFFGFTEQRVYSLSMYSYAT